MSLLDGGPRSATVIAETAIRVLVIRRRHFSTLLREAPGLMLKILATLARRVRDLERARSNRTAQH
jgi:CRP-like cAMP-binding protein